MAANSARRGAGRIEEDHIERPRLPLHGVSRDRFCTEMKPGEVAAQPLKPLRRMVNGEDAGACGGELGGLAARCSA